MLFLFFRNLGANMAQIGKNGINNQAIPAGFVL
jgi:hypothetical protein